MSLFLAACIASFSFRRKITFWDDKQRVTDQSVWTEHSLPSYIHLKKPATFRQESSRSRKLSDWNQELDAKSDGTGRGHCNPPRSSLLHHIECSTDRIIIFRCYGYSWIIVFWLRLRRPYSRQRGYDLVLVWLIISWCWCGSNYIDHQKMKIKNMASSHQNTFLSQIHV